MQPNLTNFSTKKSFKDKEKKPNRKGKKKQLSIDEPCKMMAMKNETERKVLP